MSSCLCGQQSPRSDCTSAQSDLGLCCRLIESLDTTACPGWIWIWAFCSCSKTPFCLTWPVCYVMKVLFGYVPLFIDKHIIVLRPLKIIEYNTLIWFLICETLENCLICYADLINKVCRKHSKISFFFFFIISHI